MDRPENAKKTPLNGERKHLFLLTAYLQIHMVGSCIQVNKRIIPTKINICSALFMDLRNP